MEIVEVPINKLKPAEYNPRKADEKQVKDLTESIKRFGLIDPIICNSAPNRKNVVIGGHFRLRIAKQLGYKKVPVYYVYIRDLAREQELNLRLNRNVGEWDFDLLANFDEDLLVDVGFENSELEGMFDLNIDKLDPNPLSWNRLDIGKEVEKQFQKLSLKEYISRFQTIYITISGGKDSTACMVWAKENFPKKKKKLIKYGMPSVALQWCHDQLKRLPLKKYFSNVDKTKSIQLNGVRAEESSRRKRYKDRAIYDGIHIARPLLNWKEEEVYDYLKEHKIKIMNTYQYLDRLSCFACPFQSPWRWNVLRQKYPELFLKAVEYLMLAMKSKSYKQEYVIRDITKMFKKNDVITKRSQWEKFIARDKGEK